MSLSIKSSIVYSNFKYKVFFSLYHLLYSPFLHHPALGIELKTSSMHPYIKDIDTETGQEI